MSHIDVFIDTIAGAGSTYQPTQTNTVVFPTNGQINYTTGILKSNSAAEQKVILKSSANYNNFNLKQFILRKYKSFKKRNNNNKHGFMDVAAAIARIDGSIGLFRNLQCEIPKEYFACNGPNPFADVEKSISNNLTEKKELNCKVLTDPSGSEGGCPKQDNGLDLFFQSLLKSTSDFTEEETIELQIKILKIIKYIKEKRDLKQNLRKYASASMCFRDSATVHNDFKSFIYNLLTKKHLIQNEF